MFVVNVMIAVLNLFEKDKKIEFGIPNKQQRVFCAQLGDYIGQ